MFSDEKMICDADYDVKECATEGLQNETENKKECITLADPMEDDLNTAVQGSAEGEKLDYARFVEMMTKKIDVVDLSVERNQQFCQAIQLLEDLKLEIMEKRDVALETGLAIKNKVLALREMKIVNIDEEAINFSDERLKKFIELLDTMAKEIARSVEFYQSLISSNRPAQVVVMKNMQDTFDMYILDRIKNIKAYVRKAKKDLAVSFSRYSLGFDYQSRQLEHIEALVAKMQEK